MSLKKGIHVDFHAGLNAARFHFRAADCRIVCFLQFCDNRKCAGYNT